MSCRSIGTSAATAGRIRSIPCAICRLSTGSLFDSINANLPAILPSFPPTPRPTVPCVKGGDGCSWSRRNLPEGNVKDRIFLPIPVIVVPPLRLIRLESLRLHRLPQPIPQASGLFRSAGVVDVRPLAHFIVFAGHGNFFARGKINQGEIHRAPPVVLTAFPGIRHELLLVVWRRIPEYFRDRPGPVSVEYHQSIPFLPKGGMGSGQSLGGRTLQKCPRLAVHRSAQEVVRPGVADVQFQ